MKNCLYGPWFFHYVDWEVTFGSGRLLLTDIWNSAGKKFSVDETERIIDWIKLPATELMQVLKEGPFLVVLVWFGPDLKLKSWTHPLSRLILYQHCPAQSPRWTSPY